MANDKKSRTPAQIANYLLSLARSDKKNLTVIQVIKLTYFVYAWYLALHKKKLFGEKIQAWQYGPVIPSLYHEFKRFGRNPIEGYAIDFLGDSNPEQDSWDVPFPEDDDEAVLKIANIVWQHYGSKTASQLISITHKENSAWSQADKSGDMVIQDDEIEKSALRGIKKYVDES